VLRYGAFYGAANDGLIEPVRKRQYPIIDDGGGITSWIHLEDAAAATVLALDHEGPAIYNIVDDEPAPVRDWLPVLVEALDAKPPRRFPTWLARLFAGEAAVVMGTESPRRVQREGQARARLDPALSQLAPGIPGHLLGNQRGRPIGAAAGRTNEPLTRLARSSTSGCSATR
jgi:nucleoside-diphosphate-sugar epimerase